MFNVSVKFLLAVMLLSITAICAANEELRDPTRPLGHVTSNYTAKENTLRLQSVLISDTRKVAYINGQRLREQDTISNSSNIKVIRIEANGVVLQQGEKRWRLELNKVVIRQ